MVDGAGLLITPLRHTVVPPPMSAVAAALPAPVTCLAIRDFGDCEVSLQLSQLPAASAVSQCVPCWPAVCPRHPSAPPRCSLARMQAVAAALSDGSLALLTSVEEDLWEETLEEQEEEAPWDGYAARPGLCMAAVQAAWPERGASHCRSCPVWPKCPALHAQAWAAQVGAATVATGLAGAGGSSRYWQRCGAGGSVG